MTWGIAAYLVLLFVGAAIALPLARYAWIRRATLPGGAYLTVWLLAIAEWCAVYLLFFLTPDPEARGGWFKLTYVGGSLIAASSLAFALAFAGQHYRTNRGLLVLLTLEPIISWGMLLTNDLHGLFWSAFTPLPGDSIPPILYDRGPWGRLRLLYIYIVEAGAMLALLLALPRSSALFRRHTVPVLLTATLPFAGSLATAARFGPFVGLDLTPGGFAILVVVWGWVVFRWRAFDVIPVARYAVFDGMADAVAIVNADGLVVDANPAALRLLERSAGEVLRRPAATVLADWLPTERPAAFQRAFTGEVELGQPARTYEVRVIPWSGQTSGRTGYLITMHDSTERQDAQELALLNELARAVNASLSVADITAILRAFLQTRAGVEAGRIWLTEGTGEGAGTELAWGAVDALRQGTGEPLRFPLVAQGESFGQIEVFVPAADVTGSRRRAFLTVASQYAGASIRNARLYEEVDATRRELQVLSRELVEVQESERLTLASELHDEIGQYLTALQISLTRAADGPVKQPSGSLTEAQQLVGNLMQKVRNLSLDLRPPMLDTLGVLAALTWHFERYTTATAIRVHFDHIGLERRFGSAVETAVYRIIQEALTNVARHAGVGEVAVDVWVTPCCIDVEVRDLGAGFSPTRTPEGHSGGLAGMRQRAAARGGRLQVEAAAGAGVRVTAQLPFDADQHERYHANLRYTR